MNKIPLVDLSYQYKSVRRDLLGSIERVLDSGHYILGDEVVGLEREVASLCGGMEHAVGVANGTDALTLMLRAFDVGPGDEVITTPFTFFATAEAIVQVGGKPVFVDVDKDTFLLRADEVEKHITEKTKAILVVHLFGQMANTMELRALADKYGLYLFEDACQAIGAHFNEYAVGQLAHGAALSFFPTKNLGTYGDGGMILLHDCDRAERVRRLRAHGSVRKYVHDEIGCNSRLDELHGAILRVKLRKLEEWNSERITIAKRYHAALADLPLQLPLHPPTSRHVYHLYSIVSGRRDELQQALTDTGIGCGVYYPVPLHLQTALRELGHQFGDFPVAERLSQEILSIPLYPGLKEDTQDCVIHTIRRFFGKEANSRREGYV